MPYDLYGIKERRGECVTSCIVTSHALANELLNKPNGYITAACGENEYMIKDFSKTKTEANIDDSMIYWKLNLCLSEGCIKR